VVPAVTEMLFAIGAGPLVVGVGSYDTWPPEVRSLPKIGALLDPDIERIIELRADLAILHASQDDVRAQLGRVGVRTFSYELGGLDNVMGTMRRLGTIVGRERGAEEAARGLERRLEALRQQAAGRPRPRTLLVFGHDPGALRAIDASGGIGFLHDIVELVGGENVYRNERRESLRVSTEAVIAAAPEVIIDLRYGQLVSEEGLKREREAWNGLPAVPAVRAGRVYVLVGDRFVVPGPRVVDAAEEIAGIIRR
jgi:iron complex transport system substrate-binding protein